MFCDTSSRCVPWVGLQCVIVLLIFGAKNQAHMHLKYVLWLVMRTSLSFYCISLWNLQKMQSRQIFLKILMNIIKELGLIKTFVFQIYSLLLLIDCLTLHSHFGLKN